MSEEMLEEVGNMKDGPRIVFVVGDEEVLLRPYVYGWELCRKRNSKDKTTGQTIIIWQGEKYYSTVAMAINALFELQLRASDASTLVELKARIEEIKEQLTEIYDTKIPRGTK